MPQDAPIHIAKRFVVTLFAGLLLATGCETTGESGEAIVSLEEAKAISARFEGKTLEPPARSVADILEGFGPEREIPDNCQEIRADREPTVYDRSTSNEITQWNFAQAYMRLAASEFFIGDYGRSRA
jgi:hypothetical protein